MTRFSVCGGLNLGGLGRRLISRTPKTALPVLFLRRSWPRPKTHSSSPRRFWTLSFSGAGHLMPYHLGVAKTFLSATHHGKTDELQSENTEQSNAVVQLPIRSVSGSSSGAIAATVMTILPHRLEEYTDRFLQDRGHAFRNLHQMLEEEEAESSAVTSGENFGRSTTNGLLLSICTTRCSDGNVELFSFTNQREANDCYPSIKEIMGHERLFKAIEASCRIPRSFHPIDVVALNFKDMLQMNEGTYPDQEGIVIDEKAHVDGGIAAPFPPTLLDGDPSCTGRIVVSPIAGEYFYKTSDCQDPLPLLKAIKPATDTSWKVPWITSVPIFGSASQQESVPLVAVHASPSLQNLRNMTTAIGVVPASPKDNDGGSGVLRDWYERGQEDAHEMLNGLKAGQQ